MSSEETNVVADEAVPQQENEPAVAPVQEQPSLPQEQPVEEKPPVKPVESAHEGPKKTSSKLERQSSKPIATPVESPIKRSGDSKELKPEVFNKYSDKSLQSLGKGPSKESSRDLFPKKKSQRSISRGVGSIISFRRGSIAEYFDKQRTAKFMNTYKLDSEKPFNVDKVTNILEEVLIEALDNLTYDADKIPKQTKWASSAIRAKVKEQEYDRYKILCIVTIGEKRSQDMYSTYRFLWDTERDKHASFMHENMSVFAIALCFGLYYE